MIFVVEAGRHPAALDEGFLSWLEELGIEPKDCYRVVIDTDNAVLTALCYKRNAEGVKYVIKDPRVPEFGEAAVADPITVPIDSASVPDIAKGHQRYLFDEKGIQTGLAA